MSMEDGQLTCNDSPRDLVGLPLMFTKTIKRLAYTLIQALLKQLCILGFSILILFYLFLCFVFILCPPIS